MEWESGTGIGTGAGNRRDAGAPRRCAPCTRDEGKRRWVRIRYAVAVE